MEQINRILGITLHASQLTFEQIILRGLITGLVTVAVIRLAGRRFLARRNPVDVMLAFVIGSMLARAINGNTAFWPTLGVAFVLGACYRALVLLARKFHGLGRWIKGEPQVLVKDGQVNQTAMNRHQISRHDLMEDLHLTGKVDDIGRVKLAFIERNGGISVLRKPEVFNVSVKDGVQIVEIQIS